MKSYLQLPVVLLALASGAAAQAQKGATPVPGPQADMSPQAQAGRIEAAIDARDQRARAEHAAKVARERLAGIEEARLSMDDDRRFIAVWSGLASEVRSMYAARQLAERLSKRPEWQEQTPGERMAAVTTFITDYPAIKAARQQKTLDTALGQPASDYPLAPAVEAVTRVLTAKPDGIKVLKDAGDPVHLAATASPPVIAELPEAQAPDLFTINRRFYWNKPHGQWMNQMLKDIDEAKARGNKSAYDDLVSRYSAWAGKYLRREDAPKAD